MHIVVCLKPAVPAAAITYDPRSGAPLRPVERVTSLRDAVALQMAFDLQCVPGTSVTALAIADERADPLLRRALCAGATRAIRVWDADGGSAPDTWSAARVAGAALGVLDADLVLCGSQSDDLGDGYFPAALAAGAGCELLVRALSVVVGDHGVEAVQKIEGGWRVGSTLRLPAVVAVEPEATRLRHHAVLGRVYRAGLARAVEVWGAADVGLAVWPAPLLEELELALPRARTRAAPAAAAKLSAKDRLKRKKAPVAEEAAPVAWDGPPDVVARQLLERIAQWLQ